MFFLYFLLSLCSFSNNVTFTDFLSSIWQSNITISEAANHNRYAKKSAFGIKEKSLESTIEELHILVYTQAIDLKWTLLQGFSNIWKIFKKKNFPKILRIRILSWAAWAASDISVYRVAWHIPKVIHTMKLKLQIHYHL